MTARVVPLPHQVVLFRAVIRRAVDVSDEGWRELFPILRLVHLTKGEHMLRAGERALTFGFVLRGILRQYECVDGREHNMAFSTENHLFGSLTDLLSGNPSSASIDCLEDVEAISVSWAEFQALCARNDEWNTAARAAANILVASKTKREKALLALDAEDRYRLLVERRPEVAMRVPLYHLASYLGMRPEHLSRVRRKLATPSTPRERR